MSSGLGEVLRYAQLPFFGSKLAGRRCNFPNIAVTSTSSSAVAGQGDGARALVTEVTGSDVTMNFIYHNMILKHEPLGTTICVYIDDIGIATCTNLDDHIQAVSDVLCVAEIHDL